MTLRDSADFESGIRHDLARIETLLEKVSRDRKRKDWFLGWVAGTLVAVVAALLGAYVGITHFSDFAAFDLLSDRSFHYLLMTVVVVTYVVYQRR